MRIKRIEKIIMVKRKKEITPFPYNVYVSIFFVLTLAGLFTSIYLFYSHYRIYTDISYKSFCAITKSINCDTVSQSKYSIFMGVPVPLLGVFGYGFVLFILLYFYFKTVEKQRMWSLMIIISAIYSIYSIVLAFISAYYIKSYCIMCILTYGVNVFMLYFSWLTRRRFSKSSFLSDILEDFAFLWARRRVFLSCLILLIGVAATIVSILPNYWEIKVAFLPKETSRGITANGHPWIGAETPELIIHEYTDYQCFQCKKMHNYLRQILSEKGNKIRLVHHNFPMDHEYNFIVKKPLHVGSGKMALLAIYAAQKDIFWEINDELYALAGKTDQIDLKKIADKFNLNFHELASALNNPVVKSQLSLDLWEGMKSRITGTPAYVIDGTVYTGQIPPEILKKNIE